MSNGSSRWAAGIAAVVCLAGSPALVGPAPEATPARAGETCGTIRGIACDEGLWCDVQAGACAGRDLEGACVRVPDVCSDNYDPVCGCDGKTYSNDCTRIMAKAQKDHAGECTEDDKGRRLGEPDGPQGSGSGAAFTA